jgi:hypothetical protein
METPRLEEFTEDQLRLMLRLVVKEKRDLSEHVKAIQKNDLGGLLVESIAQYSNEIETIDLWATQLATALYRVKQKQTVINN